MLYATNTTIVKGAEEAAGGPLQFCLGRFAIAALALSPLLPAALANLAVRRCGIEMGLWTALAYLSQAFALITTGAGRVSFISTFTMIEVPLVAGLLGAHIPPLVWAATASAVAGVLLLEANSEASTLVGDGLALLSAMAFGLQIIRSNQFAKQVPPSATLDLISMQASTWPWLQMAYTGIVSTALCLWLEILAFRHVAASDAAVIYTLDPLYSAVLATIVLHEEWTTLSYIGAALIFGGSVVISPAVLTASHALRRAALLRGAPPADAPIPPLRIFFRKCSPRNRSRASEVSSGSSAEASAKEEPNVKDLALKARLALSAEEEEEFGKSISRIVDWFGQLQQVDLSDVPAAIRVGGEELRPDNMREDVVVDFENREEMLSQVPKMDGPFLKVPNVLPSN
ncbi:unnamed protein product [Closterium sp. Yama58-4]|nr:unnamed protein product [Closterium sp. Yama58-4]